MTDKAAFRDEEYQFPQDDYIEDLHLEPPVAEQPAEPLLSHEEEPVQKSKNILNQIWNGNRRMVIAVGVAVVVVLVFSVARIIHKPEAQDTNPAPSQTATPAVVQQPVVDPQILDQLNGLKSDSANNNAVIRQLQAQIQQLTMALNQSRAQQQQLNQSMMVLLSQVQQLSAQVKILTLPKPVAAPKSVEKTVSVPPITYQLRAVVPGRAWIVGSDGQSQSVAVGDIVPQYGNVQSIDADAGVIITTSGKTIKFQ
ncbi:MAG: hypothetical protein JSR33_05200 [Proteobacteria bacterium]|nr:hypothetical protein [Pseudomonadota bacterium]